MAVYFGSSREIRVGDRVVGIGSVDGLRIDGYEGTVVATYEGGWYACGVRFDLDMGGHSLCGLCEHGHGYKVPANRIAYISTVSVTESDGKIRCRNCNAVMDKTTRLGVRLFKDTPMCDECVTRKIGEAHGYHYGKNLRYAYAKDKITLGVEIEIDDCDDEGDREAVIDRVIKCARDNNYALIMSHETDGSLNGYGFESVTAPLTIAEWKSDEVREQIIALLDGADDNGYRFYSDDHAGLHVHIGRRDLCGTDRKKSDAVGLLMGWAVSRLWNNGFKELSRRGCTDYCHLFDERGRGANGLYDTGAGEYDRYYAVNIDNSSTIELRIFKGARCLDDVLVAVDMCYMLGKWATKKINTFSKRGSYSAYAGKYDDALAYADRITWDALVKYSKFPEVTLKAMREVGIKV